MKASGNIIPVSARAKRFEWFETDRKGPFDGGPTGLDCPARWTTGTWKYENGKIYIKIKPRK